MTKGFFTRLTVTSMFIFIVSSHAFAGTRKAIEGGQILNCYCWTYQQISSHLDDIVNAHFTTIQISSAQPLLNKDDKELWWKNGDGTDKYAPDWAYIYEPLGFRIADNGLGTVAEFKALVTAAHAKGLNVVVGVEANSVSNKKTRLDSNVNNDSYFHNFKWNETSSPAYVPEYSSTETCLYYVSSAASVKIWVYDDKSVSYVSSGWPGDAMTIVGKNAAGENIFKWTKASGSTGTPTHVIFNPDGLAQSATFDFHNNGYYFDRATLTTCATNAIKVYCRKTKGQAAPYLYAWNSNGNLNGEWPGTQMSDSVSVDGKMWYVKTLNSLSANIIFNDNNGIQTDNIENLSSEKAANAFFSWDPSKLNTTSGHAAYTEENVAYSHELTTGTHVYVKSDKAPYLYAYNGDTKLNGEWPGAQMTSQVCLNGQKWWRTDFLASGFSAIINNGSGNQASTIDNITSDLYLSYDGNTSSENLTTKETNTITKSLTNANGDTFTEDTKWDDPLRTWITHANINLNSSFDYTLDLNTESTSVQTLVKNYLQELHDAGVDGVCWYHAKYIGLKQGWTYYDTSKYLPQNTSRTGQEGSSFWPAMKTKMDALGLWSYADIGMDPYYKNDGRDNDNWGDGTHFACKYSDADDYFRNVREYLTYTDLADDYLAAKNVDDAGCSWQSGFWTEKTTAGIKFNKDCTPWEVALAKHAASKKNMVYFAEDANTYCKNWFELNGKTWNEGKETYSYTQSRVDRAYARVASQGGVTVVYFARPASDDASFGADFSTDANHNALHFKDNLITQLNIYHEKVSPYYEYITDKAETIGGGDNAVASSTSIAGAVIIRRWPWKNSYGDALTVRVGNGDSYTPSGTYTDVISGNTFTVAPKIIKGEVNEATGVAVLFNTSLPDFSVTPVSGTEADNSITITIKAGSKDLRYCLSYGTGWSSGQTDWSSLTKGASTTFTINASDYYSSKVYNCPFVVKVQTCEGEKTYTGWWGQQYTRYTWSNPFSYSYELRNLNSNADGITTYFHMLYFKLAVGMDPTKFSVYSWAEQNGVPVVLTNPKGNTLPASESGFYHPIFNVYEEKTGKTDYPLRMFVSGSNEGSLTAAYDRTKGGDFCDYSDKILNTVDVETGEEIGTTERWYRMSIGAPSPLNFKDVKVTCAYNGVQLQEWDLLDGADDYFEANFDSKGQPYLAPVRSIGGSAIASNSGWGNDKVSRMTYDKANSSETVNIWSYSGQINNGSEFRILAPIDYQTNYILPTTETTTDDNLFRATLTTKSSAIASKFGYSATDGPYTTTAGYCNASDGSTGNINFSLPTGRYTVKLYEEYPDGVETPIYYYTVSKPIINVIDKNHKTLSVKDMSLSPDKKYWMMDNIVVPDSMNTSSKLIINDIDNDNYASVLPVESGDNESGFSEAGNYRVTHVMRYSMPTSGTPAKGTTLPYTHTAAVDHYYLGFNMKNYPNVSGKDVSSGYWRTYSDGQARVIPTGVKAYAITGYSIGGSVGELALTPISNYIPAYTGVMLYSGNNDSTSYNFGTLNGNKMLYLEVQSDASEYAGKENYLHPMINVDATNDMPEPATFDTETGYMNFYLGYQAPKYSGNTDNKVMGFFYVPSGGIFGGKPFYGFRKAYLSIPKTGKGGTLVDSNPAKQAALLYMDLNESPTGIASVVDEQNAAGDGDWYTLQGIRVERPQKGVYIHNGKKVIVK